MCGRTACTLAPDSVCQATSYRSRDGKRKKAAWRDAPNGRQYFPSHNIAPGAYTPIMLSSRHFIGEEFVEGTERVIQPMKWGLVPSWHKGDPNKMEYETNNCRAEGMLTKRTYKVPLEKGRRCIVLADGFFEWKRTKESKQPYFIYFPKDNKTLEDSRPNIEAKDLKGDIKQEVKRECVRTVVKEENITEEIKTDVNQQIFDDDKKEETKTIIVDRMTKIKEEKCDILGTDRDSNSSTTIIYRENEKKLLTVAGVFDIWKPPDGTKELYSYSIITVEASPAMAWIHHRMPAVLKSDQEIDEWLDFGRVPLNKASKLIRPTESIAMHPVSSTVNNSRNKSPDCVIEIDLLKPKKSASTNFMMNWLGKSKNNTSEEQPAKRFKNN